MFCQNCGKQIPENVKFCNYCGAVQTNGSAQRTQQETQAHTEQQRPQQPPHLQTDEKAFKKYVTPYISRNIFIVMAVINMICFVVTPMAGVIYSFYTILFGIAWAYGCSKTKKRISRMQSAGTYEEMLREFAVSSPILDDKVRYSENYIFGKGSSCFFHFQAISWVYRHTLSYFLIPIRAEAMIGDSKGEVSSFCKLKRGNNAGGEEIKALAALIYNKNQNVILGFDAEREKEFKKRTK